MSRGCCSSLTAQHYTEHAPASEKDPALHGTHMELLLAGVWGRLDDHTILLLNGSQLKPGGSAGRLGGVCNAPPPFSVCQNPLHRIRWSASLSLRSLFSMVALHSAGMLPPRWT